MTEADRVAPCETGGVLVGYWARPAREVVITAVLGPGPRAVHLEERFEPDSEYHRREVARLYEASGRLHSYLGDWHTHPRSGPWPSPLDHKTLRTIARDPGARAATPLMAILGVAEPGDSRRVLLVWRHVPRSERGWGEEVAGRGATEHATLRAMTVP